MTSLGTLGRNAADETTPTYRGRRTWTVLGLVAALVVVLILGSHEARRHWSSSAAPLPVVTMARVFPQAISHATVHVTSGSVTINAGTGTRSLVVNNGPIGLTALNDTERVRGGGLDIQSLCGGPVIAPNCNRNYNLSVPNGIAVNVSVGTGNVVINGITGAIKVTAINGSVQVHGGKGSVHIATNTGSVGVTGTHSATNVSSSNGTLMVNGGMGTLHARTQTGFVTVRGLKVQGATVFSRNGKVAVSCATAPEKLAVMSETGPVTIGLPVTGATYAVTTKASTGPVTVSVATDPKSARSIKATSLNGPVEIHPNS